MPRFKSGWRLQKFAPTVYAVGAIKIIRVDIWINAAVAKQADARDLKSLGVTTVPVQIRPAAPKKAGFTTCLFYALPTFITNLLLWFLLRNLLTFITIYFR